MIKLVLKIFGKRSILKKWRRVRLLVVAEALALLFVGCRTKGVFKPEVVSPISPSPGDTIHISNPSFNWEVIEGADRYHIQIDNKRDFNTPVLEDSSLASPPFTPPVFLEDGGYYWRIRAKVKGVWGGWSEPIQFFIDTNPFEIKGYSTTYGYAHAVQVEDGIAYVADGEAGLTIINVEDPQNPYIVGNWDGPEQDDAWGVYKMEGDTLLYMADYYWNIKIFNVSDPENPQIIGSQWARYAMDIMGEVLRDTLFIYVVASWGTYQGLNLFDASIPGYLVQRGPTVHMPASSYGVFPLNGYVYIASGQWGLQIVDARDPDNSVHIGGVDTPGNARDVWISGNKAYVADGLKGVSVINIEDPTNPILMNSFDLPGYSRGIYVENDTAFVATGRSGLQIVDFTDFENPKVISILELPYAYGVFKKGAYIYVATRDGLFVVAKKPWAQ